MAPIEISGAYRNIRSFDLGSIFYPTPLTGTWPADIAAYFSGQPRRGR